MKFRQTTEAHYTLLARICGKPRKPKRKKDEKSSPSLPASNTDKEQLNYLHSFCYSLTSAGNKTDSQPTEDEEKLNPFD